MHAHTRAMDRVIGEVAKQAGVPAHVLRAHAGTIISFVMFHSSALLKPRTLEDRLMVYALLGGLLFSAHVMWVCFMQVLSFVLGDYTWVAQCCLAAGVPTFGITLPVYRFKRHQSQRKPPPTQHQPAAVLPGVIPSRRR